MVKNENPLTRGLDVILTYGTLESIDQIRVDSGLKKIDKRHMRDSAGMFIEALIGETLELRWDLGRVFGKEDL